MSTKKINTNKKTYPNETKGFWANHFAEMEKSPLSRAAYCRKHNLNYDRMQYWRTQLWRVEEKKLLPVTVNPTPVRPENPIEQRREFAIIKHPNGTHVFIRSEKAFVLTLNRMFTDAAII